MIGWMKRGCPYPAKPYSHNSSRMIYSSLQIHKTLKDTTEKDNKSPTQDMDQVYNVSLKHVTFYFSAMPNRH